MIDLLAESNALSGHSRVLFPARAACKNVAPRVAVKLDVGQISDITKVDSADAFERSIYACGTIATAQDLYAIKITTARTTGFNPAAASGGSTVVETVAASDSGKSSFVGAEITKIDQPELTAAKLIVSGGRAVDSSDKFNEVLTSLADKLGASCRAAVDAAYTSNDWQFSQTGKIVRLGCERRPHSAARSNTWTV